MSAEKGNRYAEKWTYESTMKALDKINFFAMQEETLYLGMALARAGYYDDIWRYWRKKWARNFEIMHEMKQLMQLFEARLFTRAAMGKMPVSLSMFALRHHYGWGKEQQVQEDLNYLVAEDLSQNLSEGEGLIQTAGPIQTFPQGEGFNTTTADPIQAPIQGESVRTEQVSVDEPVCTQQTQQSAKPVASKSKKYPIELTPEELEMETGISDIREIERRMREDDPELAEFDDMDEDIEWEVMTPETFRA